MLDMQARIEELTDHVRGDMAEVRDEARRGKGEALVRRPRASSPPSISFDGKEGHHHGRRQGVHRERRSAARGCSIPEQVPILPLRDTVLFPQSALPLGAGRESSVRLLEDVVRGNRLIGVFTQRDASTEEPQETDLHRIGTLATVHKILKQPDGSVRLVVQGSHRIRIVELSQVRPYLVARIAEEPEISPTAGDLETEALARNAVNLFRQVVELSPMLPDELTTVVQNVTQPDRLGDFIAATLPA